MIRLPIRLSMRSPMLRKVLLGNALACLISISSTAALAQDYPFQGLSTSFAINELHGAVLSSAQRDDDAGSRRASSGNAADASRATGSAPGASARANLYTPSPVVRRQVEAQVTQAVASKDPAAARQLTEVMRKQDFIALFDQALRPVGLKSGNVVDVLTAYWLTMWGAANDYRGPPARAQVQAVRAQVASTFDANRAGLTTDAKRQEFAETLILRAVLMVSAVDTAQKSGKADVVKQLGDAAQRELLQHGIDLRSLAFTSKGLVARR